jgi:hydroxymethylglutaryl-CoA lyase
MQDIIIHDVGMRDGLQVERDIVPFEQKVKWIEKLLTTGIDIIQVGSFVHPVKVPQMADTDKLFSEFSKSGRKTENVILSGLVLNEKGLERGMSCGVEMFCMGSSASDTHSRKNTGMGTKEATERIIAMGKNALAAGKQVQVSVQSAFGCGFEGNIPEDRVLGIVKEYLDAGFKIIMLADTAGHADPVKVDRLFTEVLKLDEKIECACHFHDTYGLGLANCYTALKIGVKYFEVAFAGLGGCPFTAIASGNTCTEDFVHMLNRLGIRKDIKIDTLIEIAKEAEEFFKRELPGKVHRIGVLN